MRDDQPSTLKQPAHVLSDTEINAEEAWLGEQWDAMRSGDCDHGGSPGEWIWERMGELETEAKRRAEIIIESLKPRQTWIVQYADRRLPNEWHMWCAVETSGEADAHAAMRRAAGWLARILTSENTLSDLAALRAENERLTSTIRRIEELATDTPAPEDAERNLVLIYRECEAALAGTEGEE